MNTRMAEESCVCGSTELKKRMTDYCFSDLRVPLGRKEGRFAKLETWWVTGVVGLAFIMSSLFSIVLVVSVVGTILQHLLSSAAIFVSYAAVASSLLVGLVPSVGMSQFYRRVDFGVYYRIMEGSEIIWKYSILLMIFFLLLRQLTVIFGGFVISDSLVNLIFLSLVTSFVWGLTFSVYTGIFNSRTLAALCLRRAMIEKSKFSKVKWIERGAAHMSDYLSTKAGHAIKKDTVARLMVTPLFREKGHDPLLRSLASRLIADRSLDPVLFRLDPDHGLAVLDFERKNRLATGVELLNRYAPTVGILLSFLSLLAYITNIVRHGS